MSLNSRIKDVYASLTTSEKIIADYFLVHREEVETSAVKDLAENVVLAQQRSFVFQDLLDIVDFQH